MQSEERKAKDALDEHVVPQRVGSVFVHRRAGAQEERLLPRDGRELVATNREPSYGDLTSKGV